MAQQPIPFIGIVGPTAVGKTELSLLLAENLGGEIISADSMQVYKHMDIGTAKLPLEERRGIIHHMIDVVEPTVSYTVFEYATSARMIIRDCYQRGNVPIVVGGTGLYFRSLVDEFDFTETDRNDELRNELSLLADQKGSQVLHEQLSVRDAEAANRIHPNDTKRLIRALEIVIQTGRTVRASYLGRDRQFQPILIGLTDERERLYKRIDDRVEHMMKIGLQDEVQKLVAMGCGEEHTSMQAIGYKEMLDFLYHRVSLDEAVQQIKKASRRYAKRQFSWFRADRRIWWYHLEEDGMMNSAYLLDQVGSFWQNQGMTTATAPEDR